MQVRRLRSRGVAFKQRPVDLRPVDLRPAALRAKVILTVARAESLKRITVTRPWTAPAPGGVGTANLDGENEKSVILMAARAGAAVTTSEATDTSATISTARNLGIGILLVAVSPAMGSNKIAPVPLLPQTNARPPVYLGRQPRLARRKATRLLDGSHTVACPVVSGSGSCRIEPEEASTTTRFVGERNRPRGRFRVSGH